MHKTNKTKKTVKIMEMIKKINVGSVVQTIVVIVLLFLASILVLSKIDTPLKLRAFSVDSGSMVPALPIGNLILVRPFDSYNVGDIVTYTNLDNSERLVTHRIVEVYEDPDINSIEYLTKGDANEDADTATISKRLVIGKVVLSLPLLGHVSNFAKTQMGFMFLIVIPATILVYSEVLNIKKELVTALAEKRNKKHLPRKEVSNLAASVTDPPDETISTIKKQPAPKVKKAEDV